MDFGPSELVMVEPAFKVKYRPIPQTKLFEGKLHNNFRLEVKIFMVFRQRLMPKSREVFGEVGVRPGDG